MARTATVEHVPSFYLYGEPQRAVGEGFVHVESLDDRSRPSEWTIQSHIHRDLNHLILIAKGGGSMLAEAAEVHFEAPCILLVPAGVVHGFAWHRESSGHVTTLADSYLRDLTNRDEDLARLFHRPLAVALAAPDASLIDAAIRELRRELAWAAPGQRAAIDAALLSIMVRALRGARLAEAPVVTKGRQANLVARLRDQVENRFRLRESVSDHARTLGVSLTALRLACAQVAGTSPAAIMDDRTMLEARRLLLYSSLSISQIAYAVGFEDPTYFSRFFARQAGIPPRRYRLERAADGNGS